MVRLSYQTSMNQICFALGKLEVRIFMLMEFIRVRKMAKRGPKPKPYRTYQKRYPRPLEKEIDKMVAEWKRENGYD